MPINDHCQHCFNAHEPGMCSRTITNTTINFPNTYTGINSVPAYNFTWTYNTSTSDRFVLNGYEDVATWDYDIFSENYKKYGSDLLLEETKALDAYKFLLSKGYPIAELHLYGHSNHLNRTYVIQQAEWLKELLSLDSLVKLVGEACGIKKQEEEDK